MKDETFDLCEIRIYADTTEVRAQCYKFKVKQTRHYYIQIETNDELHAQGYTWTRLGACGRIPVDELNKINHEFSTAGYCRRSIYVMADKKEEAFKQLKLHIAQAIDSLHRQVNELSARWQNTHETLELREKTSLTGE